MEYHYGKKKFKHIISQIRKHHIRSKYYFESQSFTEKLLKESYETKYSEDIIQYLKYHLHPKLILVFMRYNRLFD